MKKLVLDNYLDLIFIVILIVGVVFRLYFFSFSTLHPYDYGDFFHDLIIVKHINIYHEISLTGPGGLLGSIITSPFYYYFVSLLFKISDSPIFLGYINIFLQTLTLVFLYILASKLFGRVTGLISVFIFSLSAAIIFQSTFFINAHTMHPFALLSYLFLVLAYKKSKSYYLFISIFFFCFAGIIYNAVFVLTPIFIILVFYISKNFRDKRLFLKSIAAFLACLFIFFLPVLWFITKDPSSVGHSANFLEIISPVLSPYKFVNNLLARSQIFFQFFIKTDLILPALITFLVLLILYLRLQKDFFKKKIIIILLFSVMWFLFIAVIMSDASLRPTFPPRYFIPILSLFVIMYAEVLRFGLSLLDLTWPMVAVLLAPFIILDVLSSEMGSAYHIKQNILAKGSSFFKIYNRPDMISEAIVKSVIDIRTRENRNDFLFFQIKTPLYYSDTIFWDNLEEKLGVKLVKVDDRSGADISPLGSNDYIFLICYHDSDVGLEECKNKFLGDYRHYVILEKIHSSLIENKYWTVYLTKRK